MAIPTPSVNPTPKQEFMSSDSNISAHRKMVDSAEFRRAIDFATRHFVRGVCSIAPTNLESQNHMVGSAISFERIQGMNDFVDILIRLSETPPPRAPSPDQQNLKE